VGRGLRGRGSGLDGRRMDGGRRPATPIRPGSQHGQRARGAGRHGPMGDVADVRGGRGLLRRHGARAPVGPDYRPAGADRGGLRGHAGGGEPRARGGRLSVAAHYLGLDRAGGGDHLACRGLAPRARGALGSSARRGRCGRHRAPRSGRVVRTGPGHGIRPDRAGRAGRGGRPGGMATGRGAVLCLSAGTVRLARTSSDAGPGS
jgi:hypothetical protein